jgi:hypothetical protein
MVPLVVGVVGGIMVLPSHVATPADLKQMKTEITTEFKKSMELERDISRLNNVTDSLVKSKQQLRQYPKDADIAEEVEMLKAEKVKIQDRIQKR